MKRVLAILCITILTLSMLAGCADKKTEDTTNNTDNTGSAEVIKTSEFDYSSAFDKYGFFRDLKTSDYVKELPEYLELEIPADVVAVDEAAIEAQVEEFMFYYGYIDKITDRAVAEGDRVNIDFVGTVDGKEFEAGNTKGEGLTVIAGSEAYVKGFLNNLIGHHPGETYNIEVTLPADFEYPEVAGKDAVFKTTINYIEERSEFTDAIVKEHLTEARGWKTAEEALQGLRDEAKDVQIRNHVANYLTEYAVNNVDKTKLPEDLMKYFDDATVAFFTDQAGTMGISFESYIMLYNQAESKEALLAQYKDNNIKEAQRTLLVQAIAEHEGITLDDADVLPYMTEIKAGGEENIKMFGMPYVKHILLYHKVIDLIVEAVKLP